MMTVRTLKKTEKYSELSKRERVVIFITRTDVLRGRRPLYTIERVIREVSRPFNDGTRIIYVNTSHKDTGTALGKLIHDLRCRNPKEWYYTDIMERAEKLKGDDGIMKAIAEMKAKERADTCENIALSLIKLGNMAFEDIAKICHLTLDRVRELAETVNA